MPQFLPKEAPREQYGLTTNPEAKFISQRRTLISEVARKMHVEAVEDVGRVPSLFSRAYTFFTDLFPNELGPTASARPGRREAHEKARRQFRGILCVLAFRDTLDLKVEMVRFNPAARPGSRFREIFADAYKNAPKMHPNLTWANFRYLTIRDPQLLDVNKPAARDGTEAPAEALCGLSPFTLFFPSMQRLSGSRRIFWYDYDAGEWWDPTTDWTEVVQGAAGSAGRGTKVLRMRADGVGPGLPISYSVILTMRRQMHAWLQAILDDDPRLSWKAFGLDDHRAELVTAEMAAWQQELGELEMDTELKPARNLVGAKWALGLDVRDENRKPLLVRGLEEVVGDDRREVSSELPRLADGRVILSKSLLTNREIRICGSLMGKPSLDRCLANLGELGEGFIIQDGNNQYHFRQPYVVVDKLFVDTLHQLPKGDLSPNFFALPLPSGSCLIPLKPNALQFLDLNQLFSADAKNRGRQIRASAAPGGGVLVEWQLGDQTFTRLYPGNPNQELQGSAAQDSLDVRIWPNFYFSDAPRVPACDEDRCHYFRVRQAASWHLNTEIVAQTTDGALRVHPGQSGPTGWDEQFERCRQARFYAFENVPSRGSGLDPLVESKPVGLHFPERGFFFFQLEKPRRHEGNFASTYRLGVDFGTSNTCVTWVLLGGAAAKPEVIRFETLTASLLLETELKNFLPDVGDAEIESGSALLDFPYLYSRPGDPSTLLSDGEYFPSQVVTRKQKYVIDSAFTLSNGLMFLRNPVVDCPLFSELIKGYPGKTGGSDQDFLLKTDIKWRNRFYRRVFLWHLYKMVTYHAARRCGVISEAAFSFPRAFDEGEIVTYKEQVRAVFQGGPKPTTGRITVSDEDFISESEAVQRWEVHNPDGFSHLILDVGGGTTDYLVIHHGLPVYQASHVIAATFVNKYFEASSLFRGVFAAVVFHEVPVEGSGVYRDIQTDARQRLGDLLDELNAAPIGGERGDFSNQALFGLLALLKERYYPSLVVSLRNSERVVGEAQQKAVRGFFFTLALLYGGIAYAAGQLLRESGQSIGNLRIDWVGNGARYYQFLDSGGAAFGDVVARLFSYGYQRPMHEVKPILSAGGKAQVAKGLLFVRQSGQGSSKGSLAIAYAPAPVIRHEESFKYLCEFPRNQNPNDCSELLGFLQELQKALPQGKYKGVPIIPFCDQSIQDELSSLFPSMHQALHDAENSNAERLRADLSKAEEFRIAGNEFEARKYEEAANAVETRFITHLKVLLRCIRAKYAPAEENTPLWENSALG